MLRVLIVEDTPNMRARLVDVFTRQLSGYEVLTADNRDDAIALLATEQPDLVLLDLVILPNRQTPEGTWQEGREVLRWARKARPQTRVIILSSMGHLVRDFLKEEGADDFFTKDSEQDWRAEKLLAQVEAMLGHLVCRSPATHALREQLKQVNERDALIVVQGEESSGKEYLSRLIHSNSPRARQDFVRLPVTALRPSTLLADLVGERGEFSRQGLLESQRTGTLFFDGLHHVGMIDPLAVAQLSALLAGVSDGALRFTPLGSTATLTSHCRLIFSTTVSPDDLRDAGALTPELHAALRQAKTFILPPLAQRQEDVGELLEWFRRAGNRQRDVPVARIEPGARQLAEKWVADGLLRNAAELASVVGRVMDVCTSDTLREEDLRAAAPASRNVEAKPQEVYESAIEAYREAESAYRQAEETEEKMRHLEKLATLGQMVAGIAHEVKNPLTAVYGFASTLRRPDVTPEQVAEFAQAIMDEARRINDLVNEVREFGKADVRSQARSEVGNGCRAVPAECRLTEVIEETLHLMQFDPNFRRARVVKEFKANPIVTISHDRLKQVLLNLLKNAAEATQTEPRPSGSGTITLTTAERGGAAEIKVSDNGCGIAPEDLTRIWEPFFTTKGVEGTGLGLDICRKIIEAHGGSIAAESTVGEGTTFTVRLPLV